jgi:hypothetical protein
MRVRKISWPSTSCYYPYWVHSHSELADCTLLEMLDVFRPCILVQFVAPTNISTVFSPLPFGQLSPTLRQTRPPGRGDNLMTCGLYTE